MSVGEDTKKRATLAAFGQVVKRLRIAGDLTQEELAERAGVSARLISDLERGTIHRPRRDTVQLLADGFGLSGAERESFVALARGRPPVAAEALAADTPSPRRSLPAPPTPIVGRLKETAAVTSLLLRPEVRLLTLTGPGGVGKTRLALEVGSRTIDAFPDGAIFVDLAPVRDPALVVSAIAQTLGVRSGREQPLRETLISSLQGRRLLLVLDNVEHLASSATMVADLLASCAQLTVLATSRQLLRIRAEREYPLAPLALPDLHNVPPVAELGQIPAIDLFVHLAEAANREFALTAGNAQAVAEIAVRLDGLPLAIELAAARVKVLSPAALLARLERRLPLLTGGAHDLPTRQQAMRSTIDWSHDLLSPDERRMFRQLAVFAGGCTLDAVERVGGRQRAVGSGDDAPPETEHSFLDGLTALVDKSLLRVFDDGGAEQRFGMLETIREYALERLGAAGEEATARGRHAAWCLELAEQAEPQLTGPDQGLWYARLASEHDNLRAALGWAIAQRDAGTALRLGGALYRFWATGGQYDEGRGWLEQALATDDGAPTTPRGNTLLGAGVMTYFKGDYEPAAAYWEEALALFRALGDATGIAYSFGNLGLVADAEGDYERAASMYEEALTLFRELGDRTYVGFMLNNLGLIAYFQGDYERAAALHEESLALARALGVRDSVAYSLGNLGLLSFVQGDLERATALQEEALRLRQLLNNRSGLARCFENFALIAAARTEPARAARLFGAAEELRDQIGAVLPPNDREFNERYIAGARARLGDDGFTAAWEEGRAMSLAAATAYALGQNHERSPGASRSAHGNGHSVGPLASRVTRRESATDPAIP